MYLLSKSQGRKGDAKRLVPPTPSFPAAQTLAPLAAGAPFQRQALDTGTQNPFVCFLTQVMYVYNSSTCLFKNKFFFIVTVTLRG